MASKSSVLTARGLFGLLLLISLFVAAGSHWWLSRSDRKVGNDLFAQALTAQRLAQLASAATSGSEDAFKELRGQRPLLPKPAEWTAVVNSKGGDGRAWESAWLGIQSATSGLMDNQDAVLAANRGAEAAIQTIPGLLSAVDALTGQFDDNGPAMARLRAELKSLPQGLLALARAIGSSAATSGRVGDAQAYIGEVVRALHGESTDIDIAPVTTAAGKEQLAVVQAEFDVLAGQVRTVLDSAAGVSSSRRMVANLDKHSGEIAAQVSVMSQSGGAALIPSWMPYGALGVALLSLLGLLRFSGRSGMGDEARELERQANQLAAQNQRNQGAILHLLDELGSLADGDLTVQATVTEDITGAIADSINYAIEALRGLVTAIDTTTHNVHRAAQKTQASARHLARASENQSKQVFAATESIANMAESIEEVSGNAERSAEVARHSVEIAHKGGDAVRRTIDGMNTIRETIQETSKRIKRLGESSQEIGNIVELINDIAEQTNILALNASIQASMAGDAGRGFAVVADEVQRLAERSANATKQIEVLVKTIQSDTNEAVVSMERSTTDVVSGALLAENAGESLDEIEKVSNQIANLVTNISASARQQATAAADITRNMGVLQEISAQTAENTNATSQAIAQLADYATELGKSVSGFTLPDEPRKAPVLVRVSHDQGDEPEEPAEDAESPQEMTSR